MEPLIASTWMVLRHGGKRTNKWRCVFKGEETKAYRVYMRMAARIRRGQIKLMRPDGTRAEIEWGQFSAHTLLAWLREEVPAAFKE